MAVQTTVADHLLERLRSWPVDLVFGYPGDGINGILSAWGRADDAPRFVQVRHEEMAALAAVGYAKFSGRVGVCLATSGSGAVHLLNGLYDALLDHVPVVAIVGQTRRSARGGAYQQEVNLQHVFADVAGAFLVEVNVPEQLPNAIDRALRTAEARRAPTVVIVPADVQDLAYNPPAHAATTAPSSQRAYPGYPVPDRAGVSAAAEILNAGQRVAILAGRGARGARTELQQVADLLGAGIAKALLGKDVLPDDLPYVTGAVGPLGTRPSHEMMRDCDTLLVIGSSFPYPEFLPQHDRARAVQIDIDPSLIGLRYPFEVNLVGDAALTLQALIPELTRKIDRGWQEKIAATTRQWWQVMEAEAHVEADPVNPMRLFWELGARVPTDALITVDSGSAANGYARHLPFRGDVRGSLSGTLATMGAAVPYAIGAKVAFPDRPVIAFAGDGAMQMNGLTELITVRRYWSQWSDPRLIVAVLHNNELNQVSWELRALGGSAPFEEPQTLPDVDYAAFATSLGMGSATVTRSEEVAPAWQEALRADRPFLLDVHCSPDIPPIPPHATFEQARDAAAALAKGDTHRLGVIKEGLKTRAQELFGGRTG